jgi:hypothetical protein
MRWTSMLLVLALGSGCGDSLSPSDVVGTYTLTSIDGSPPPKLVVNSPDCQQTVIGGSLVMEADQGFEMELELTTVCPTPTGPGEVFFVAFGEYRVDGDDIVLTAHADVSSDFDAEFNTGQLLVHFRPPYGDLGFTSAQQ